MPKKSKPKGIGRKAKRPATPEPETPAEEITPAPRGRPSAYSDEIAATICTRIAEGDSLRKICKGEGMPSQSMVYRWLDDEANAGFREQYARARAAQGDTYADRIGDIGEAVIDGSIKHDAARVAVDALKWAAGKLAPKKYGDRVALDHGAQDSLSDLMQAIDGKSRGLPGAD